MRGEACAGLQSSSHLRFEERMSLSVPRARKVRSHIWAESDPITESQEGQGCSNARYKKNASSQGAR